MSAPVSEVTGAAATKYQQDGAEAAEIAAVIPYFPFKGARICDGAGTQKGAGGWQPRG